MFKMRKLRTYEFYQNKVTRLLKANARLFLDWFEASPAENFIRVTMGDRRTKEQYLLTIQRIQGKNPIEVQNLQELKIVSLRNALREIGELAWDVSDPEQAKVRLSQVSEIAGIADE